MIKRCTKCKSDKPETEFYKWKLGKDGLRSHCKQCHRESASSYYKRNTEKCLEWNRKYAQNNKERVAEIRSAYYQENKEWIAEWKSQYQKNNKAMFAEATARRKSAKLNATPAWLTEDDLDVIAWTYEAAKDREDATGVEHHVDHVIPLQGKDVCGLHVWWNLQVITASDNLHKSNNLYQGN